MTYPILLHHKMRIAKEYMEYEHHKGLAHQGGVSHLLGQTRKRFHVVGGKARYSGDPAMFPLR